MACRTHLGEIVDIDITSRSSRPHAANRVQQIIPHLRGRGFQSAYSERSAENAVSIRHTFR